MEYISHVDYKGMMENFKKGTPKAMLNESIEEASTITKKPAAHLKAGDVLTSGATVVRGAQAGARTPSGKVDLVVRYPNGKESLVVWGKTTTIGVRNSAEPSEDLEKEGNAFTAGLAKAKKGEEFKVDGKSVKDTSNYDADVKEEWDSPYDGGADDLAAMARDAEGKAKVLDRVKGDTYRIQTADGKIIELDFDAEIGDAVDPPYGYEGHLEAVDDEGNEYIIPADFISAGGGSFDVEPHFSELEVYSVKKEVEEAKVCPGCGMPSNQCQCGEEMDESDHGDEPFDFNKAAIESASGDKISHTETDDYGRAIYWSTQDPNVTYYIGSNDQIIKYSSETGERFPIGDLNQYDEPTHDFEPDTDADYEEPGDDFDMAEVKKLQEIAGVKSHDDGPEDDHEEREKKSKKIEDETDEAENAERDDMEEGLHMPPLQATGNTVMTNEEQAPFGMSVLSPDERKQLKEYITSIKTIKEEIAKLVAKTGKKVREGDLGGDRTNLVMTKAEMWEEESPEIEKIEAKIPEKLYTVTEKVIDELKKAGLNDGEIKAFIEHEIEERGKKAAMSQYDQH